MNEGSGETVKHVIVGAVGAVLLLVALGAAGHLASAGQSTEQSPVSAPAKPACLDTATAGVALTDAEAQMSSFQALGPEQMNATTLSEAAGYFHSIGADWFKVATAMATDPNAASAAETTGYDASTVGDHFDDAATAYQAGMYTKFQADLQLGLDGIGAVSTDTATYDTTLHATTVAGCART